jgi:UDP-glucose 4-epimerase
VKAVVTGAAGFIGSCLVESLLADGHEVVGVDAFTDYYARSAKESNLETALRNPSFQLVEGRVQDLSLEPILAGTPVVFHLAAQAGVRASWGREFTHYTDHNVLATQRLLEAALQAGRPRVVYASSSSVYGDSDALPLREDAPCRPVSPYGVTKLAGEHLAILYAKRLALPDVLRTMEGVTGRPFRIVHDDAQKGDMRDTYADTTAARRDLGFRSTVALPEGLEREWAWIRGRA